jgi:hypothetical protein
MNNGWNTTGGIIWHCFESALITKRISDEASSRQELVGRGEGGHQLSFVKNSIIKLIGNLT